VFIRHYVRASLQTSSVFNYNPCFLGHVQPLPVVHGRLFNTQRVCLYQDDGAFGLPQDGPDQFKILGVSRTAPPKKVRERYFAVAKELHPDATQNRGQSEEDATKKRERFTEISEAFKYVYAWSMAAQRRAEKSAINRQSHINLYEKEAEHMVAQVATMEYEGAELNAGGPDWGGMYEFMAYQQAQQAQTAKAARAKKAKKDGDK
jgi:hypothetical protein